MRWTTLLLPLASSCVFLRSPEVPMPAAFHPAPAGEADRLCVLLPGFADAPEDFVEKGFVDAVRAVDPRCDVLAADAHFGYYRTGTVADRLRDDWLQPLAPRYDEIWLVGISMGGFGCTMFAQRNPGVVSGLILLAPYMGAKDIVREVEQAGGLASWSPGLHGAADDDETRAYRDVWAWYRGYATEPQDMPRLYLGFGADDGLHAANGLVAEVLPPEQVLDPPGGHSWTVWKPVFEQFVQRALTRR